MTVTNDNTEKKISSLNNQLDALLYPNPTSGSVQLEIYSLKPSDLLIQIYNLDGEMVKQINGDLLDQGINDQPVDLYDLRSGIYFIRLIAGDAVMTVKVMKS